VNNPLPGGKPFIAQRWVVVGGVEPVPPTPPSPVNPDVPPAPPTEKVTAAVYVYEKDQGDVPAPVTAAIGKLNDRGILATTFENDATNPNGQVPAQYTAAVAAARAAGLPAFVVMAGSKVRPAVKSPTTESEIMEAAK
jgi:hypothetical protein